MIVCSIVRASIILLLWKVKLSIRDNLTRNISTDKKVIMQERTGRGDGVRTYLILAIKMALSLSKSMMDILESTQRHIRTAR